VIEVPDRETAGVQPLFVEARSLQVGPHAPARTRGSWAIAKRSFGAKRPCSHPARWCATQRRSVIRSASPRSSCNVRLNPKGPPC
jgi:hypothetical protein